MKKSFLPLFILGLFVFSALPLSSATTLASRLKGRILLQVEDKGQAWYVDPVKQTRAYLGRPDDAFKLMREFGLGISESDYNSFKGYAPRRLSGQILLRVQAKGEAYYVDPIDQKMHFLGRPADAFNVMRTLGLGISNSDLNQISTNTSSGNQTVSAGIDTDGDGLSDKEESDLGTDKNKADTDGDNFSDFIEASNGYNPLGSGVLKNAESCFNVVNRSHKDNCYLTKARDLLDPNLCRLINSESSRGSCLTHIARISKERRFCDRITDVGFQKECFKMFGGDSPSMEYCKSIENISKATSYSRDECIQGLALDRQDVSLCKSIVSQGYKDACYREIATVKRDLTICDTYSDNTTSNNLDICYSQIARMSSSFDLSMCGKLGTNAVNCYIAVAARTGDPSICEKISTSHPHYEQLKNSCISNILFTKGQVDSCVKITNEDSRRDCIRTMSISSYDVNICSKVAQLAKQLGETMSYFADQCYTNNALAYENKVYCGSISDLNAKDKCFASLAKQKNDHTLCSEIVSSENKDSCYIDVAVELKDVGICSYVTVGASRNACYRYLATVLKDASICENIDDSKYKETCKQYASGQFGY